MYIKNGYCIYPIDENFQGQEFATLDDRIVNANKIAKFNKRDGFQTIQDCMDYADKYFFR